MKNRSSSKSKTFFHRSSLYEISDQMGNKNFDDMGTLSFWCPVIGSQQILFLGVRSQAIPISSSAPSFQFLFLFGITVTATVLKRFSWFPFSSFPNLRNEFIPKCYLSRSIVLPQPRFHIEGQVKLVFFGERVPDDWRRAGARGSWRTGRKTNRMRCFLLCSW